MKRHILRAFILAGLVSLLMGCGQSGHLYLPDSNDSHLSS
jgi:predicted small lipoprotein YifL